MVAVRDDLGKKTSENWNCSFTAQGPSREGSGEDPAAGGSTPESGPVRSLSHIFDTNSLPRLQRCAGDRTNILELSVELHGGRLGETFMTELGGGTSTPALPTSRRTSRSACAHLSCMNPLGRRAAHVRSADDGLQAWQARLRAPAVRNPTSLMSHLLGPTFATQSGNMQTSAKPQLVKGERTPKK